jgi:hypothetical protein
MDLTFRKMQTSENYLGLLTHELNIIKMATLPKFIYRSNTILIKILTGKPAGPKN